MRISRRRINKITEGDMTPMIDMTFQLIAFFMVLVNFSQAEQDQRVQLPESELARPPEAPFDVPITLQVTAKGEVILAGETFPLDQIKRRLLVEADLVKLSGKSPGDATVIIRAHREVAAGKVQELIKLCQEARFEKFALRAKEPDSYAQRVTGQ